jgi:hypothetical protein
VIPGLINFTDPSSASDFLQAHTTIRATDNSVGGMFSFNYDVLNGYFLQRRIRVFYNSQCCGVAFDYQTVNLANFITTGTLPPVDRRFTISFTLAGIGTFASPLGSFSGSTGTSH